MEQQEIRPAELFRSIDRVRRVWQSVSPCPELSKSQFGTLLAIFRHTVSGPDEPPITLTALASLMRQSVPALSQRIRVLEDAGYIQRIPDPGDRRTIGIRLTPEGNRILAVARDRFNDILNRAMDKMGDASSQALIRLMQELSDALEQVVRDSADQEAEKQ